MVPLLQSEQIPAEPVYDIDGKFSDEVAAANVAIYFLNRLAAFPLLLTLLAHSIVYRW